MMSGKGKDNYSEGKFNKPFTKQFNIKNRKYLSKITIKTDAFGGSLNLNNESCQGVSPFYFVNISF
jgi:hypothetical protein